jgi:hypothetical protein
MNAKSHLQFVAVVMASGIMSSCTAIKKTSAATAEKISSYAKLPKLPDLPSLADTPLVDTPVARLMPAGGLKVVEVREKDLQKMPTGKERAEDFRKERKKGFWFLNSPSFDEPLYFEEPSLPEAGGELDATLLPPLDE